MTQTVKLEKFGGPEVLSLHNMPLAAPGPGEVRVNHHAIGLNFIDTYHRSGLYPVALPSGLGCEAAGVVAAVGQGVTGFKVGDRVAYGTGPLGAYAMARNIPAEFLIHIPDSISDETAAAMMLKGMTVRFLLQETYKVKSGDTILLHAAAGGLGQIAVQWAKALGAVVIGTVGSQEKIAQVKALGADHVINLATEDFVARVKDITKGAGVPVVYDGIGKTTFMKSLDCLKPRGLMVSFGNASGPVDDFNIRNLATKGSLYLTRPTLFTYTATREALEQNAADVMAMIASGKVKIPVNQRYSLAEVAQAHQDMEARKTTGASVLMPKPN